MIQQEILSPSLKAIGEEISHELGAKMVKDFQDQNTNSTPWYLIGSDIILKVLSQPDCAGIRFYNAINELGETTLVYVGVDSEGKDLLEYSNVTEVGEIVKAQGIVADRVQPPGGTKGTSSTTSWYSSL
ncbi:hypothetical protein [Flavihumibacter petaseus]|uniref:Uncharacterized protein n=1 Tax=Flavihumibacter petaseus NBRC 106054 TaxID=1220578 RepID=A0A0E9N7L0_9BACT|nr:hypothetical protein [Flavihumibacter petaseus]GAO45701.1 hypothetical protein FPE01S_08_00210 [Flavihumibacter petaseus NBRC 106054]